MSVDTIPSMADAPPATPAGTATIETLAANASQGQPANPAPATNPVLFGGFKGGRRRLDGLRPGSPEALAADREKERIKKQRQRDRARVAATAALPAAIIPAVAAPAAPALGAMPGNPLAAATDNLGGVESVGDLPLVRWTPKDIAPVIKQTVGLAEELCRRQISTRCRKARLPDGITKEIESDTKWAENSKRMIEEGVAEISAQQLNKAEVPVEVRPWINVTVGVAQIGIGHMKVLKRLDELISSQISVPTKTDDAKK